MTSVTIVPKKTLSVIVHNNNGVLSPAEKSDTTVTDTSMIVVGASSRFDSLQDVIEGNPSTGDVPVYDSATDKYVVLPITVDGGTF